MNLVVKNSLKSGHCSAMYKEALKYSRFRKEASVVLYWYCAEVHCVYFFCIYRKDKM